MTKRETEVLRTAGSGLATDEIATRLRLSPATVRNYLSNAIAKAVHEIGSTPSASPRRWLLVATFWLDAQ